MRHARYWHETQVNGTVTCKIRADFSPEGSSVQSDETDMTEHNKDTEFLKQMLRSENTDERRILHDQIAKLQRDAECVKRIAWLAAMLSAVGAALFLYGRILLESDPFGTSRMVIRVVCELGLGSFIALCALAVVLGIYRYKLNRLRAQCRRIVTRSLESQSSHHISDGISKRVVEAPAGGPPVTTLASTTANLPTQEGDQSECPTRTAKGYTSSPPTPGAA